MGTSHLSAGSARSEAVIENSKSIQQVQFENLSGSVTSEHRANNNATKNTGKEIDKSLVLIDEFKDDFVRFGEHGGLKNLYREGSDAGGNKEISQAALRTVPTLRMFGADLMSDIRIS